MIWTSLLKLDTYKGISVNLDNAIDYIKSANLSSLSIGRNNVDNDAIFINVSQYDTKKIDQCIYEGHKKYIDIHILTEGCEFVYISHSDYLEALGEYDEVGDCMLYKGDCKEKIELLPGYALILFPDDIHMPQVAVKEKKNNRKLVVKVLV